MGKCILITDAEESLARLDRQLPRNNRMAVCGRSPAHRHELKDQAAKHWPTGCFWRERL
jgi:hypothetical protein